ncbi:hypothetical protein EJ08DRAFT_670751 [Tothia fuscella]|uniref:Alpha/beta hydrolase fold-3 domain-containing protein n=1 Tax=Tothia fuscella TaxID=1048955 RepID=A0A9P4NPS4_9PEZI|nr:hypothetical protein EJ08DRAFT_670751 [Tothia fuscella]
MSPAPINIQNTTAANILLDQQNQAFVHALEQSGGPPLQTLAVVDARGVLESITKHEPAKDISVEEIHVQVGGKNVSTFIYKRKEGNAQALPFIFYTHGGGWILGSPSTHANLMEDLARESGCAIVFPYYTPAPDAQFPVQFEESFGLLEWTDKYVCAGDSVGGHMAIAMNYLANVRSLSVKPSSLVLFYPVTTTSEQSSMYQEFENGPYLTKAVLEWMTAAFLPKDADRKLPISSPLNFMSGGDLAKFPPTTILCAGVDPLREEAEEFGYRLQKLGVDAATLRVDGQIHDFAIISAIRTSPGARAAISLAALKAKQAHF